MVCSRKKGHDLNPMQIERTNLSETSVKLLITATSAELFPLKSHVLGHFRSKVKIAGFREGKAPLDMVEKNVDPAMLQSEFLEEAVQNLYVQALDTEKIRPVDRPEVQLKKFVPFTDLQFEVEVPVIGTIKLPDYAKMKKTKTVAKIEQADVDNVITALQKRLADKKDVERASKNGDQVWIDFSGIDAKGKPIDGADGKDYPIILGSNTFIPGFETNVVGMEAGQEKTFTLTFPKEYGVKALASKKVTFTVTVTKVQEVIEPKVDDAFAAKAGPFKSVDEMTKDIKQQIQTEKQYESDRNFEAELIKSIADKSTVPVPDSLVEDQIERSLNETRQNLMYRGQTYPEFLEAEGVTEEEYRAKLRPQAEERLKASLVLAEIAEREQLQVTPEELEVRIQVLRGQYQDKAMREELEKPESRREIAARMLTEKTIQRVVELTNK